MNISIIDKLISGELPIDFNWNCDPHPDVPMPEAIPVDPSAKQIRDTTIVSEDLRDGLHGIAKIPHIEKVKKYIDALTHLGIKTMTVGIYPGDRNKTDVSIKQTLKYLARHHPEIVPIVLTLTTDDAITWTLECKRVNPNLHVLIFMGTSPSRLLVEEWQTQYILERLKWAISTAVEKYHIPVIGATEHTTQTPPEFLRQIITTTVKYGAKYFCIADTVGIARPIGVYRIVHFTQEVLRSIGAGNIQIDWHGHDDLGNAQANAMCAIAAGARRVHTVARGIGERAGNTRMESVIMNMAEILNEAHQESPFNLTYIATILDLYNDLTGNPPPTHGPFGIRAFSTSLGIHTSAILKAKQLAEEAHRMEKHDLADKLSKMAGKIYSGIDAAQVGREMEIHVGPWSGISTVHLAAKTTLKYDIESLSETTVTQVLATAKKLGRELTREELENLLSPNHDHS